MLTNIAIAFLLLFIINGCDDKKESNDIFQYSGFSNLGIKIIEGSFSIEYGDTSSINGEWNFNAIDSSFLFIAGAGEYIGTLVNNEIWIDLNIDINIPNYLLEGTVEENIITGNWIFTGAGAEMSTGNFIAEK